jgi:hypothetical protein
MTPYAFLTLQLAAGLAAAVPKRKRGRPRKFRPHSGLLTGPLPRQPGRPPKYDSRDILALVDEHRVAAAQEGRVLGRRAALREALAVAIKEQYPGKYRILDRWRDHYESELGLSKNRALSRAFHRPELHVECRHLETLARILDYAVKGRPTRRPHRR